MTSFLAMLGGAAAAVLAQAAEIGSSAAPVRLEYRPASSCADRSQFIAEILARTERLREARPDEPARSIEVTLTQTADGITGHLRVRELNGAESERTIRGSSCGNVVSALGLIVALAIDPEASTDARPAPRPRRLAKPEAAPPPPAPKHSEPRVSPGAAWGFGPAVSLRSAVAPDPLLAFGGFVKLEASGRTLRGASVELHVDHGSQTERVADGGGDITATIARLAGCPFSLRTSEVLAFSPCVDIEAGMVRVSGVDTPNGETVTRPWLTIGAAFQAGLTPLRGLAIEPELGVGHPLIQDRYYLRPSTTVHEVPPVTLYGGLSVGVVLE